MFRPRIIPVLLLQNNGLVKSVKFRDHKYIGDPINAVKIYNDLKADELVFLDINASQENRLAPLDFVKQVGEEANMPFSVGGGIRTIEHIRSLIRAGAEKAIINTHASAHPDFVKQASDSFGSSTIVVCMDVKKKLLGGTQTWTMSGTRPTGHHPIEFAQLMEKMGAGELIVQSIERDGMMNGYDLELVQAVADSVKIPVVALGGAGNLADMKAAHSSAHANGLAAGSLFVFQGVNKGVLINYPERSKINALFQS